MNPDEVERIFSEAAQIVNREERMGYLRGACRGDQELRARVDELLNADSRATDFMPTEPGGSNPALVPSESMGDIIDHYRLLENLGEGGCGVVYVAEQTEPIRRRVALKIIKLGMDTKAVVARFEAERQALAMMDHPNIAKVLDAGATETGRPYFVMELVRGVKITDYCERNNLSTQNRLNLFIRVCHAIQHAHQKGIIHRDIKPSNILVTLHDGVPVPKVIDFGIAKATEGRLTDATVYTHLHQFIGTPAYVSPEQAEVSGLDIDTRADIYSLGVLLYELLTDQTPFDPKDLMASGIDEMRKIIREKEPPRPSTKFATLSGREQTTTARRHATECPRLISLLRGDLDWIVMKCLEKDRTRRYETATGLAADIQRHLQNEPIVARPPSAAYRLRKAWRRNKVLMTAALAVVLSLSGGILVSVHQTIKALYAKEEAVNANRTAQTERDIALEQRERAEAREEEAQRSLYAAKMNLAQQAWEEGILERVRQLLDETSSHEDRGFEWYYWQRQIHLEERTLRGHIGIVLQLAFSPDSQRLLTGSGDHTAKVWDVNTGKELFTLNQENTPTVEHPRPYGIPAVAFSPSGKLIALGSADNTIGIWDADSRERLLTFSPHDAPIWSVAFSPDERSLVTGSMGECEAKVWNVASGRPLSTLRGHTNICLSAAFSPSGRQILTASHDGTTRLWQAAGGEQCSPPFVAGLRGTYSFAAFSPSGAQIATDGENATVYVYDAAKGERLHTLQGHKTAPVSAAFSPDGLRIVTAGGDDRTAKVWDAKSGSELAVLKGHTGSVRSAVFSPDGTRIATASWDGTVKIWDAAVRLERFASTDRASTIFSVACSHDGTRIVSGDRDGRVQIWDVAIDKGLHTLTGHRNRIWSVAFSADGRRVVTGGWDRKAIIWDTSTGQAVRIIKDHPAGVRSVSFLSQGAQIITGSEDGKARIWDTDSGDLVHLLDGHTGPIFAAAVSPDGQQIVTGGFDQRVLVWDAITRKVRNTLEAQQHEVLAIAFSPDGERIVTGQSDGAGTVWDPNTGSKLATLRGHTDAIASLSFSPDGRRIVTGSWDGTVKLWDSMTGAELLSLKGGNEKIRSVAFSGAHGQRIIAAGGRGIPEIWEAASVEQVADWQQEERTAAELVAARLSEQAAKVEAHRRARATDPGAITEWLLLAPIHILQFSEALDATQIPKENLIRPHAGELVQIEGQDLFWRKVQLQDYLINFSQLLGGEWVERSVAYAVCYIESRTTQDELLLKVGHDDAVKIFLNGEELYCKSISRPYVEDLHIVEQVTLKRGINVLVYKAVNAFEDWLGSVRLTHRDGQPLQGISVKLEPDL